MSMRQDMFIDSFLKKSYVTGMRWHEPSKQFIGVRLINRIFFLLVPIGILPGHEPITKAGAGAMASDHGGSEK
jgi:hypothetical protein